MSWLYSGDTNENVRSLDVVQNEWEVLWTVGEILQSPGFQNYCMDQLRGVAKARRVALGDEREGHWPNRAEAHMIYELAPEGSLLRKFTADCLACNNPFRGDPTDIEAWKALLQENILLSLDVHVAGGKEWKGGQPWDAEWRGEYVVDEGEVGLDERWKVRILESQTAKEVKEAAGLGRVWSRLKLEALGGEDGE